MYILGRSLRQWKRGLLNRVSYVAFIRSFIVYKNPIGGLYRYITKKGSYPYTIQINTPIGVIKPTLYSLHDMITVNEIFCRQDYVANSTVQTVIDIGANIGLSALYFLTRNTTSYCYCYEPNPNNIKLLEHNLRDFSARYTVIKKAVFTRGGRFNFGIDPSGRYGGLGHQIGTCVGGQDNKINQLILVEGIGINNVLSSILKLHKTISLLKIDTEGAEVPTIKTIRPALLMHIKQITFEAPWLNLRKLRPRLCTQTQNGFVCNIYPKV